MNLAEVLRVELRRLIVAERNKGQYRAMPLTVAELVGDDDASVARREQLAAAVEREVRDGA